MFSKISRYRTLPDLVTTDARGRTVSSKTLRLLPTVTGTFLHTVEEMDRLEHLAFKYYQQPRNWWRICDANPEFMAPQALLGKEPIVTVRFPLALESEEAQPAWAGLLGQLAAMAGVERVQVVEQEVGLVQRSRDIAGTQVTVVIPRYERAVIVTYNQMNNVGAGDLVEVMAGEGFTVGPPEPIGRVGKPIVIPPDVVG
jgi:hypothetical protein